MFTTNLNVNVYKVSDAAVEAVLCKVGPGRDGLLMLGPTFLVHESELVVLNEWRGTGLGFVACG